MGYLCGNWHLWDEGAGIQDHCLNIEIWKWSPSELTVRLCTWQGEIGEPGQKGSKGDKGEQVSRAGIVVAASLEERGWAV